MNLLTYILIYYTLGYSALGLSVLWFTVKGDTSLPECATGTMKLIGNIKESRRMFVTTLWFIVCITVWPYFLYVGFKTK